MPGDSMPRDSSAGTHLSEESSASGLTACERIAAVKVLEQRRWTASQDGHEAAAAGDSRRHQPGPHRPLRGLLAPVAVSRLTVFWGFPSRPSPRERSLLE